MGGINFLVKDWFRALVFDEMLAKLSILLVFLLGVIIAPIEKKLLFRAPLGLV